jgi:S-adenosylmethionine/arginine decarboxylase-like enzyme
MPAEHKHLIIRAEVSDPPKNPTFISDWLRMIVEKINMKILKGPFATYCEVEGNRGLTAFVIIETSHIVLHTWDEEEIGEMQFDVYTCSSLNPKDIFEEFEIFNPSKIEFKYLDRNKGLVEVNL